MAITTIVTSQAPDAKPVARSFLLTTNWQIMVEVPQYEVPELVFGGSTTIEPGVGEIISPLILCNITANTILIDVEVHREDINDEFYLVRNLQLPGYDTIALPFNGQFFKTGDLMNVKASQNDSVHATLSFTLGQSEKDDV